MMWKYRIFLISEQKIISILFYYEIVIANDIFEANSLIYF